MYVGIIRTYAKYLNRFADDVRYKMKFDLNFEDKQSLLNDNILWNKKILNELKYEINERLLFNKNTNFRYNAIYEIIIEIDFDGGDTLWSKLIEKEFNKYNKKLIEFFTNLKLENTEIDQDIFGEPSINDDFYINKEYSLKTIQNPTLLLENNEQLLKSINQEFLDYIKSIDNSIKFNFNLRLLKDNIYRTFKIEYTTN